MIGLHSLLWASTLEYSKETIPNVKLRYNLYSLIPRCPTVGIYFLCSSAPRFHKHVVVALSNFNHASDVLVWF